MHDEQLERRLRAALSAEAGRLPFTITAAELERRAALRGRGSGNRRLTLLLAAAVAIGALGVGSLLGGALRQTPRPTDAVTAISTGAPTAHASAGPITLPSLDELMATDAGNGAVLVAQAHDPFEQRADVLQQPDGGSSAVSFPVIYTAGSVTVRIACLGDSIVEYDIRTAPGSSPGRTMTCDGTMTSETITVDGPSWLVMFFAEPLRWRVVVRGAPVTLPLPTTDPFLPPADEGMDELVRMDDQTMDSTAAWGDTALVLQETPPIPGRFEYNARVWCPPGDDLRLILGDYLENAPELTADTETYVRCTGLPMDLNLRDAHPGGSRVFVAAAAGARWSLLITSETPPVGLVEDVPGWQLSTGFGPEYNHEEHGVSLSNGGVEGGGPLLVMLECAGPTRQVEVQVDGTEPLGDKTESFLADCSPEGSRTGQTFTTAGDGYLVDVMAPAGSWVAVSALLPDPLPTPH